MREEDGGCYCKTRALSEAHCDFEYKNREDENVKGVLLLCSDVGVDVGWSMVVQKCEAWRLCDGMKRERKEKMRRAADVRDIWAGGARHLEFACQPLSFDIREASCKLSGTKIDGWLHSLLGGGDATTRAATVSSLKRLRLDECEQHVS